MTIVSSKEDAAVEEAAVDATASSTAGGDDLRLKNNRSKEMEEVALNAFNKARLASSFSSTTTHNNSSGFVNSRESSAASSEYVHKPNHSNNVINNGVPKLQQQTERKSSIEINDDEVDDENISLNSEDLLNAGGFDGSMTISDFQLDQQQQQHRQQRSLHGSSQHNNDITGSRHNDSSLQRLAHHRQKKKYDCHYHHSNGSSNNSQTKQRLREEGGVEVPPTTIAANEKRSNHRIRNSSSITSFESASKLVSSISGIFNPIPKRRQQQQQQQSRPQNRQLRRESSSSLHSITTQNTMNSIMRKKKQHPLNASSNRVSWQLRNGDEELANELLAATGKESTSWANAIIGGNSNNKNDRQSTTTATRRTTSSPKSSKRNSSWTIADLEEGLLRGSLNSDESPVFHIGGSGLLGGGGSAQSILTPDEQQLWASMLQLATSTTTMKTDIEDGGGVSNTEASSSKISSLDNNMAKSMDRKVVQEAMNLAAAAILQTSVELGHDDECEAAGVDNDACWYGGVKGMKGKVKGDSSSSSSSPPRRSSDGGDEVEDGNKSSAATDVPPTEEGPSLLNQSSPLSQASTQQQHATRPISPTEITPATAVAVTTLAYQEVEDYRARLRRKREEMEGIDSPFTSQQRQQQQQTEQLGDLNELLLENATNINNAVLLQRALYALRIHRGSLAAADGNANNVVDSSDHTAAASISVSPSRNNSFIRTSRSEHTGLDQLALDHFLNTFSSVQSSATSRTGSGGLGSPRPPSNTASINSSWTAGTGNTIINNNQFSRAMERRHTEADAQQPGAYHLNEPAPLLFRRTFAHPNRRQNRADQRRSTMDSLNLERASQLERTSQHSGSSTPQQQRHQRNRTSSLDSGSGSLNSSHPSNLHDASSEHNIDEGFFANTLQYSPTSNNSAADTYITAQVTPHNPPDDGYNRRHLGTLLESNQSQQSNSSISSNPRNLLLTAQASVRRQSLRARQMIQAVLVSDEIVEADRIHDDGGDENMIFPRLLEEKEEEVRVMEERYRRRERVWMVAVTILVLAVIALIVTMVLTNR